MTDAMKMIEELEAAEKKAIEPPWRVEEDQKLHIVCDTFSGGKPYTGFVGSFAHNDTRDFVIAARNALPLLLRLARRGIEAEKVVEAAKYLSHSTQTYIISIEREFGPQPKYGNGLVGMAWRDAEEVDAALAEYKETTNDAG